MNKIYMDSQNQYLDFKKIKPTAIKTVQMDPDKKNKMFPDTGQVHEGELLAAFTEKYFVNINYSCKS